MKRAKRGIIERTNLFSDQPSQQFPTQQHQSQVASQSHQNVDHTNSRPQPTLNSTYSNDFNSSQVQVPHSIETENEKKTNSAQEPEMDEKKKRLQLLRQKYLKNSKKTQKPKEQKVQITYQKGENSSQHTNTNNQIDKIGKKQTESIQAAYDLAKKLQINPQQHHMENSLPSVHKETNKPEELKKVKDHQNIEHSKNNQTNEQNNIKQRVPPPIQRKGPGVPPPPVRKPANKPAIVQPVSVKIQHDNHRENEEENLKAANKFWETQQKQEDSNSQLLLQNKQIIEAPIQNKVPPPIKKTNPPRKIPPTLLETIKTPNLPPVDSKIQQFQEQNKQETNFSQSILEWLRSNPKTAKNPQISVLQSQLMQQIFYLFGDQTTLSAFFYNFVIRNASPLPEHQVNFVHSLLIELQDKKSLSIINLMQESGVVLLALIKCGEQVLRSYPVPPSSSLSKRMKKLNKYSMFLQNYQKNDAINFYLTNEGSDLGWDVLIDMIRLVPNSTSLVSYAMKCQFPSSTQSIMALKILKQNLNQTNASLYFRILNNMLPFVNDSGVMEEITEHIKSINVQGVYQLKKDALLKAIQYMPDQQASAKNTNSLINKNYPKIEKKQSEEEKGINLMGFVNQAIKKIKSQVPAEKKQEEEQSKDSIIWNAELQRFVINGVVPEDDSAPVSNDETKKIPPPPPPPPRVPRKISQNGATKPDSKPVKRKIAVIQSFQDGPEQPSKNLGQTENQEEQVGEIVQQLKQKVPLPSPPPRMGYKKPKITARYT